VVAAPDEVRDEEVLAFIVPHPEVDASQATAISIQDWCLERLAYFKAPGHVAFIDELPTTSTNKVQKARLADFALDPARRFDLRSRKKRKQ
jgi:acyl-coenzyme A synthetase/AMP-(fatty) acid ligase